MDIKVSVFVKVNILGVTFWPLPLKPFVLDKRICQVYFIEIYLDKVVNYKEESWEGLSSVPVQAISRNTNTKKVSDFEAFHYDRRDSSNNLNIIFVDSIRGAILFFSYVKN